MRVTIDRDTCMTVLPACEECFATFVLHDCYPDRACITEVEDDGRDETTIVVQFGGRTEELVVTDENRELIAYEGWTMFIDEPPPFANVPS